MEKMLDKTGRMIDYLRISITDRCNLRCCYCMPEGVDWVPMQDILTLEEICQVVQAAAGLGIRYLKVTGGEPLVRKGCVKLVRMLKEISGIEKVTITTNGILLPQYLDGLLAAGIDGINISLDTRNRKLYQKITGYDGLDTVQKAIRCSIGHGISIKINAVSLDFAAWRKEKECEENSKQKDTESGMQESWQEIQSIAELAREYPVDVRFIEMMPIGSGKDFPAVSHQELFSFLKTTYPEMKADNMRHGYGPAVYYQIPGFSGSIGMISAIHGKFCGSCNRIRLTSQGYVKSCLCYEDGVDLRQILRSGEKEELIQQRLSVKLKKIIWEKPAAHCFEEPERMTESGRMSSIGG